MENQENLTHIENNEPYDDAVEERTTSMTRMIEGDTYPISDNESTTDSVYIIDTNTIQLQKNDGEQGEYNHHMSHDSLIHDDDDEQNDIKNLNHISNKIERPSSTTTNSKMSSKMSTIKSTTTGLRSLPLDEHIRLVKQKKEEAEILRLQKFQEQLKKKEQKWQQQQVERVKKWLQLRNRDNDHRLQVEERRRKREEEARAKIDELIRREKEREQQYQQRVNNNQKIQTVNKPDSVMSMSTDVISTRRAISASRLRTHQQDNTNRRGGLNDSPDDNSTSRDEIINSGISTNGESQHRITNTNRQHLNETIHRLAKPKTLAMTQSVHISATTPSTSNGLPVSRSSHQIRLATTSVNATSSTNRKRMYSRPATVPTSTNESRTSPADESARIDHSSTNKHSSSRSTTHPRAPSHSTKPPTISAFARSKPPTQRSRMTTSISSSSISSSTTTNKRRIPVTSPSKPKLTTETPLITNNNTNDNGIINNNNNNNDQIQEDNVPVNEESIPSVELPTNETVDEKSNTAKREQQQILDEQEYQRKLNQKIREAQQRLELERQREEERQRQLELEEYEREQEQIRLVEEQRRLEQERLQRAIEERERETELKRQEELRLQQQREELERKQAEETERLNRERQERAKKEEEERIERKRRLDLIMRRTRQVSPSPKQENNTNKPSIDETNGHIQSIYVSPAINMIKSSIPHSISDNRFPTSSSTEHFLVNNDSMTSSTISSTTDIPKFKSPLIQSLLNKARNTRSIDNLSQTSMTASQIMTESMIDESTTAAKSTTLTDLSYDDHQENSRLNNTTNGHADLHLSSSSNITSFHELTMETAPTFQL